MVGLGPRNFKRTAVTVFLFLCIIFLLVFVHDRKELIRFDFTTDLRASTSCTLGFPDYNWRAKRARRVYDLVMVGSELDWLIIRLNSLAPVVDYFVLLESERTFTNLPKPLTVADNWEILAPFHDKIIYRVLDRNGTDHFTTTWQYEDFQRNAMLTQVFPALTGNQVAEQGDILLVSDTDELPRPEVIQNLKFCDFPERLTLETAFYYYSFQWLHRGSPWQHPQMTTFNGLRTILPNDLRIGSSQSWLGMVAGRFGYHRAVLPDAGWHCSSCFATIAEVRNKMSAFSHTAWNKEEFRTIESLVDKFSHGLDLFERPGEFYDRVDENHDIPDYIAKNRDHYSYMLDRDAEGANFKDFLELTAIE